MDIKVIWWNSETSAITTCQIFYYIIQKLVRVNVIIFWYRKKALDSKSFTKFLAYLKISMRNFIKLNRIIYLSTNCIICSDCVFSFHRIFFIKSSFLIGIHEIYYNTLKTRNPHKFYFDPNDRIIQLKTESLLKALHPLFLISTWRAGDFQYFSMEYN